MKTAVVVCPGRGTYNKAELGYLADNHRDKKDIFEQFDAIREKHGRDGILSLDASSNFSMARHGRGENASVLIYACSYADFQTIDRHAIDVVAVTGNSMGWYTTLACAGALSPTAGFGLVDQMGALMQQTSIGGQTVYPFVDEDWHNKPQRRLDLLALVDDIDRRSDHDLALSINLGGMLVLGGNAAGLSAFEAAVAVLQERFPMRLANHAAFHTRLQTPVAATASANVAPELFGQPKLPMIDGRGHIWWPGSTRPTELKDYTLGHQVVEPYDFTHAIKVAAREFSPDLFVIVGPGTTMVGAVVQSLIISEWRNLRSKADFVLRQSQTPLILVMATPEQRRLLSRDVS